jgi:hypothetical protein
MPMRYCVGRRGPEGARSAQGSGDADERVLLGAELLMPAQPRCFGGRTSVARKGELKDGVLTPPLNPLAPKAHPKVFFSHARTWGNAREGQRMRRRH